MKQWKSKIGFIGLLLLGLILLVGCSTPKIVLTPSDKEEYTITFDPDNGSESQKVTVKANEKVTEPSSPTKDGYVFVGWYKNSTLFDFNSEIVTDLELKAKWEIDANTLTITYVLFDNSEKVVKSVKDKTPTLLNVTQEGYTFLGWYLEEGGNVSEEKFSTKDYTLTTNIKLVSKWERDKYKVSFDTDGGSSINYQNVVGDTLATIPEENPTKDGYKFVGWYEKENEVLKETAFDFTTPITKEITLYAKWEERTDYATYFEEEMEEYFQTIDFGNFELPTTYEGIETISWTSSNSEIINSENKLTRPYKESIVTLTATIKLKTSTENQTVEFTLNVPGYKLETATTIASTFLYRNFSKMTDDLFDTMDIIYCSFAEFDANGAFPENNFYTNVTDYIIPKAKEKGVYVVLVIGSSSEWITVANPANGKVDTAIANIMTKVNDIGFDGVDVDWEKPKSGQEAWFTNFVQKLNTAVKTSNANKLVTASISGGRWCLPYYDIANSNQYLDYVNLMTYGLEKTDKHYHNALYASSSTTTSCSIDESITIFNTAGINSNKILVGLAFYGIKQVLENNTWVRSSSVLYDLLLTNYLNNSDYNKYFDDVAGVPYLMNTAGTEFISYENAKSIGLKCKYVVDNNIAGVMAWEAGCDTSMELVNAVKTALNK